MKLILYIKKYIIIFPLFIIYVCVLIHYNYLNIRVCICSIVKNENKYLREFVSHYKNYGIDKIFIYDNNEINGEKIEDVLADYIKSGFIKIINIRGRTKNAISCLQSLL